MLITLGEELLLGLTQNGHLTYIGDQLRQRGVTLHSNYTISDESDDIDDQFEYCWKRADVLITIGGLGPTVDDRTKEALAEALGESLVFDDAILESIKERFERIGKPMSENNRKQAYRPENAEALENPLGTAPGLWLEKEGKILVMLPGPPNELQPMFASQVIPRLESLGYIDEKENYLQLRTIGIGESALETLFEPVFNSRKSLSVAYCAHQGQVDCRISFPDQPGRMDDLQTIANHCKEMLGEHFLSFGHDSTVTIVSNILRDRNETLALAESCTGGMISNEFTNLQGASDVIVGSVVSYSEKVKIESLGIPEGLIQSCTAVSAEVAEAMASGVATKLGSDYALSSTGYAGPGGGTKENPVGTIFIGLHTPNGVRSKRFSWNGGRLGIKKHALNAALELLRRELISSEPVESDPLNSGAPANT